MTARVALLKEAGPRLRDRFEDIGRLLTLEMGKPLREGIGEVKGLAHGFEDEIDEIAEALAPEVHERSGVRTTVYRDPLGVAACISPWNLPALMPHQEVLPALVAGNTLRARTAVERLAMLGRDGPKRRTLLGRHLAKNGDYRAARRQFQRGLALHATAESWLAMALLHEQDGNWGLAARAHEAAIAIDARDPASHYRLGAARLEAGQPVEAVRALEVAAELAPDHKLIKLSLARARREVAKVLQLDQAEGARGAEPAARPAPADRGQP